MYSVEMPGFQRMVNKLNPRYVLLSRNYFSCTAIPGLYTEVQEEIELELVQLICGPLAQLTPTSPFQKGRGKERLEDYSTSVA